MSEWFYQLRGVDPKKVGEIDAELKVVDMVNDSGTPWTREELQTMRGDLPCRVVAHLSVGRVERQREYYKRPGHAFMQYEPLIKFWDRGWKSYVTSKLIEAMDQDFDGILLADVDVFRLFKNENRSAEQDMLQLVHGLMDKARKGFAVYGGNAEQLLVYTDIRYGLAGLVKTDMLYGVDGDGRENTGNLITQARSYLENARIAKKPVYVLEHVHSEEQIKRANRVIKSYGYIPAFSNRSLSVTPYAIPQEKVKSDQDKKKPKVGVGSGNGRA